MIYYVNGDLLKADVNYICQQVNCQGRMASGIAKSIKTKWHQVYEDYIDKCDRARETINTSYGRCLLGDIQLVPVELNKTVINLFGQQYYGYDGEKYTSYDAFWSCLQKIKKALPEGATIGFPDHIGCGLGGGNWEIIRTMIEQALDEDYEVYIYKLEV